jgi:hypothetical protein
MELSRLRPHLLYEFKSDHDLVKAIEELSLKFTKERTQITDYLNDPRLVSAYTAFYLTTNIPKLEAAFKWLPVLFLADLKKSSLIDLGAGPGTFSLAFKEWGGEGEIIQVEQSRLMREQGLKIWKGLYGEERLHQTDTVIKSISGEKFLLFGHSANEMGAFETMRFIERIDPDHILFIEPGTKDFFPEMLQIRQALLSNQFNILFPCPNSSDCPMKNSEIDWCHQFVQVSHGADVERLSQMAKKDRKLLPLIVHAYSKKSYGKNPSERLVRVLPETKFSFDWEVCAENKLERYQIMKRPYSNPEQKVLRQVLSGASLVTELEKEVEHLKRVKLISLYK